MRYPHILAAVRSAKWAIQESTLAAIVQVLGARLAGDTAAVAGPPKSVISRRAETALSLAQKGPQIAVVTISGIIGKRLSSLEMMCGGCDVDAVEAEIAPLVADPQVSAIVLHIDSPGGVVTGVPELAAKIRAWAEQKDIYAFTDTMMASAAYWLAAGCTGIFATPTADVGSIGVYMALVDDSEYWTKEGFKLVLIKAGENKADGISGMPVSSEAVTRWQAEVNTIYGMFTSDVRATRPDVPDASMQGNTFMGDSAAAAGLVDEVVSDLATVLRNIAAR
jgi:signal peptide peptidase SppA